MYKKGSLLESGKYKQIMVTVINLDSYGLRKTFYF